MLDAFLNPAITPHEIVFHLKRTAFKDLVSILTQFQVAPPVITHLAKHSSVYVRMLLARYQRLPDTVRQTFLHASNHNLRAAMIQRRDMTREEVMLLSRPLSLLIADALVRCSLTPPEVLDRIAAKWPADFREALIDHPHTSEHTRIKLAIQR